MATHSAYLIIVLVLKCVDYNQDRYSRSSTKCAQLTCRIKFNIIIVDSYTAVGRGFRAGRLFCLNGKIERIIRYREKGKAGERLDEAELLTGLGLDGNIRQGGERQLCLLSAEAREWMERQVPKGLCFARFKENILAAGLDFGALQSGDCLAAGGAVLRISGTGKKCFDECALFSGKIPCMLSRHAVFAAVEQGGIIRAGEEICPTTTERR